MGKSQTSRDTLLRINFLYQAIHSVLGQVPLDVALIRFYAQTLQSIARKCVLRLDASIKRSLCKKCSLLLVPGITARVRCKAGRQKRTTVTCTECGTAKRFVSSATYRLWCTTPDCQFMPVLSDDAGR